PRRMMSAGHGHGAQGVDTVAAMDSPVHRLDPRTKIVACIAVPVVAASTPDGAWLALSAYVAVALLLVVAARLPAGYTLRRMVIEVPFLLAAVILPFVVPDGGVRALTVALKLTASVLAMVVLSSTTPFPRLLRGFEALRAPRILVMIVSFMWRYLHVIGAELERMRTARDARGYQGRWLWQPGGTAALVATLFVRSLERGERVYLAMASRGYQGAMPSTAADALVLRRADLGFGIGLVACLLAARTLLP
ncbi:MAG: cobalt ECF transporter T component CbiQ, partial [Egibacteraceae bacterium]